MHIWTTPRIDEELLEKDLPLMLRNERVLADEFLTGAKNGDVAILPLKPDFQEFLAAARVKNLRGPYLFISLEPTVTSGYFTEISAYILDLKKTGKPEARAMIKFILQIAMERLPVEFSCPPPEVTAEQIMQTQDQDERPQNVHPMPGAVLREGMPAFFALQIAEDGEPVSARGAAFLKLLPDGNLALSRLRPHLLLKDIRSGMQITVILSYQNRYYQAAVKVTEIRNSEIHAAPPEQFSFMTRRYVRIEPSPKNPVKICVLLPGRPTMEFTALEISRRGTGFIGTSVLEQGTVYGFTILLPNPQIVITSYGMVRSKQERDDGIRYGIEFHLHPKDEERLASYIMKREMEIMGLVRDR